MKNITKTIHLLLALILISCTNTMGVEGTPQAKLTFQHLEPWAMNVARIDVRLEEAHTVQDFVKSPEDALRQYIQARFLPRGLQNRLEVQIEEASVTKSYKDSSNTFAKFMNLGGTDVYDVRYKIHLNYYTDGGNLTSSYVVTASRVMNISEHASITDREKHQMEGLEALLANLDGEIAKIVTASSGLLLP